MMHNLGDFGKAVTAAASLTGLRILAIDALPDMAQPSLRWVWEQGSLFVLLLTVLWFYRRDFKRQRDSDILRHRDHRDQDQARFNLMLDALKQNTAALQDMRGTNNRVARAVENMNCPAVVNSKPILRDRSSDSET